MSEEQGQAQAWPEPPEPPRGLKPRQMACWVRETSDVTYHMHQEFPYTCVVARLTMIRDRHMSGEIEGVTSCEMEGVGFAKCSPKDNYDPALGNKIATGRAELALAWAILEAQGPFGPLLDAIDSAAHALREFGNSWEKTFTEMRTEIDNKAQKNE